MKNTNKNRFRSGIQLYALLPLILFIFSNCAKDTNTAISKGTAPIKVNIVGTEFNTAAGIGLKASNSKNTAAISSNRTSQIPFNKDFDLVTEVSAVDPATELILKAKAATTNGAKAVAETKDLSPNVKYKLAVYDQSGNYVTERDYVSGQESNAQALNLDGGNTYTFVAYSINSASAIPAITFADPNNKTLVGSHLAINGSDDFMYFKMNMQVSGNTDNYVGIVLKHQLCQVTTIVDASQTGYNITAVSAMYAPHNSSATINLSDGSASGTGTAGSVNVAFPTAIDALMVTGTPTIINANSTAGTLTVGAITVGPLSATNLVPFTDLVFEPGVKYDVKFSLIPKDIYLVHAGYSAGRINGQIWLRHNLGASGDPDVLASSIAGNYYQFGRKNHVATGTGTATNSNWNTSMAAASAWNSGSEAAPVKTTNDPCPTGYRVPTEAELRTLISNTVSSQSGPWSTSRYASALILTSKRNKSVKLTIPAQGYWNYKGLTNPPFDPDVLLNSGNMAIIWSSNGSGGVTYLRSRTSNPTAHIVETTDNRNKEWGFNVRCIAE
ncbi:FISUMP domain-containing protein [Sphingobacterium ginsenosidimutans]|uniref:Fibrobacter succinogenes major paralogous domain-containing protein n=1 Tax=Sphingobacterium ginsenosidimutans TaxID=687845 RepID=A0ABP8A704_9SPHI